jgi:hypothetical protein
MRIHLPSLIIAAGISAIAAMPLAAQGNVVITGSGLTPLAEHFSFSAFLSKSPTPDFNDGVGWGVFGVAQVTTTTGSGPVTVTGGDLYFFSTAMLLVEPAHGYNEIGVIASTFTGSVAQPTLTVGNYTGICDETLISDPFGCIGELSIQDAPVTTTPEPTSLALLGMGLTGIAPMLRRKKPTA